MHFKKGGQTSCLSGADVVFRVLILETVDDYDYNLSVRADWTELALVRCSLSQVLMLLSRPSWLSSINIMSFILILKLKSGHTETLKP